MRASDEEGMSVYDGNFLDCWQYNRGADGIPVESFKSDYENDHTQPYIYDLERVLADVSADEMDTIVCMYVRYVSLDCECGCALYQSADDEGLTAIPKLFAKWQRRV